MARGIEGNEIGTPRPPKLEKSTSSSQSSKNQKSILGFFQKKIDSKPIQTNAQSNPAPFVPKGFIPVARKGSAAPAPRSSASLTPAPSSDPVQSSSPLDRGRDRTAGKNKENGLPSPATTASGGADGAVQQEINGVAYSSPSRRATKSVNYVESDNEEGEGEVFRPLTSNAMNGRAAKRRKVTVEESDEEFGIDAATAAALAEEDPVDFAAADDSEEEAVAPKKRKRLASTMPRNTSATSQVDRSRSDSGDLDLELPSVSTAQQWTYDPESTSPTKPRKPAAAPKKPSPAAKGKQKACATEPDQRYPWLANILDADRNPPGHPDYDPRTVYIPPLAWTNFSPFEQQYWEIKQKFWDTIVFFKKGKFYELYENDATIGHQLFDLKLTDRVNMRMVGVPEASLDHWANQFVAKGYKIARVDQMESALAKEMRERGDSQSKKPGKGKAPEKVIRRELASVLTAGTLVDGGMLQDDMSTYCVAIKETEKDNLPAFGIAFVDTATAQFFLSDFVDDPDMTKFETLSCISTKALRILKNNTSPTTIWNYLKPGKEFWAADITCREIDASGYFATRDGEQEETWPKALQEARSKDLVMSAFGALLQYLRMLKIERDLVSLANFTWYDPIRKASSLVLDGQSLINLEVFANNYDGGADGTLFAMLNRCVTPFGKRMLRQWVCHPLAGSARINARLDAVEALNADTRIMEDFTASLVKMPDLERLISRVHAGRCKAVDFVRVLEGFEQIEYTMSNLGRFGSGEGVIGQLVSSMPDLKGALLHWKNAFDRQKAKETGILVPEPGVESDFDESQDHIDDCMKNLDAFLKSAREKLGSKSIRYRDIGKEIYQLEVPINVKHVPKSWDQMSATQGVKRYYTPELRKYVRELQEAQETHAQIVKGVAGRFYARFDENYSVYLASVKIIAQLDCLISLAKASNSLGDPACRPVFVDDERSVLDFQELRHPCMLNTVTDFIPNDITLGGDVPNINLLTGANAAGKSTILRMTCIAVIMAQVGCYVPATTARLTPIDRIMSRLGAHDNLFAAQSTFFVELAETKKILSEATPRSLVILDELGRGTSSYDGVAVAEAVLHHIATHVGCIGFFATHYHSLAQEFRHHPEVRAMRMRIDVDDEARRVTFLYRLEEGVAEGSFGMHCASMCGISRRVVERAERAARSWEFTSRMTGRRERKFGVEYVPLGVQSDVAWILRDRVGGGGGGVGEGDGDNGAEEEEGGIGERGLDVLVRAIAAL